MYMSNYPMKWQESVMLTNEKPESWDDRSYCTHITAAGEYHLSVSPFNIVLSYLQICQS